MNYDDQLEFKRKLRGSSTRYCILPWSESGHCCFGVTIIDTHREESSSSEKDPYFYSICECFEDADAELIVGKLNGD